MEGASDDPATGNGTGDSDVVRSYLAAIDRAVTLPLVERADALRAVHARLQDALADVES